jgi:hypothetical protein
MVAMLPAIVWFTFDSISEEFAADCDFVGSTVVASRVGSASTSGAADCVKGLCKLREIAGQRIGVEIRDALKKYAADVDRLSELCRAWEEILPQES